MNKTVIGSRAIKYNYPEYNLKDGADFDIIGDKESNEGYDCTPLDPSLFTVTHYPMDGVEVIMADDLYTLYLSHLLWDYQWNKYKDRLFFLQTRGCTLNKELLVKLVDFFEKSDIETRVKRMNFNQTPEDFFNNDIKNPISHEEFHRIVNPNPIFYRLLISKDSVEISEEEFMKLSQEEKLEVVYEEAAALALERIYMFKSLHPQALYCLMLKKMVVSLSPRWLAIFILDNYTHIFKPKNQYYELYRTYK